MEVLTRHFHPLDLQQFIDRFCSGQLPPRSIVVTFDDGYADNLWNAKPILARHDVPATVFVTTGYVGTDREFWWDELERLLLEPGVLPASVRLDINGTPCHRELGQATHYTSDDYARHARWDVLQPDNPTPRHELYRSLCELVRPLPQSGRQEVLSELLSITGRDPFARPTHRILTREEVTDLADGGLVAVGAHTVSHPQLSALPVEQQREEIELSKMHLESILGRAVTAFAYPYGSRFDYSAQTVAAVRDARFASACSNFPDRMTRRTDRFQVPRLIVRDSDGDGFARQLADALNG
jgi:peptidoglycan/xylan/chitin deacetylase (PgdA/CDA1 family)